MCPADATVVAFVSNKCPDSSADEEYKTVSRNKDKRGKKIIT